MKYILSIDGGGIRGIIPAIILQEIEKRTNKAISQSFDLIAGTSTGGILTLGLTKPNPYQKPAFTAKEMIEIYKTDGKHIFKKSAFPFFTTLKNLWNPKYKKENIETILEKYFQNTTLKESLVPVIITSYDTQKRTPYFFKTYHAKREESRNFKMKDIARSTSAAPTYFPIHKIENTQDTFSLIDGGVFANNPAMCAYAEGIKMFPNEEICIISIGTGEHTRSITYQKAKNWGMAQWAAPMLSIVFDGVSDSVDHHLTHILNTSEKQNYFRLQAKLTDASDDMDNATPENIERLENIAQRIINTNTDIIDLFCKKLLSN